MPIRFSVIFIVWLFSGYLSPELIAQHQTLFYRYEQADSSFWSPKLLNSERIEKKFGSYGVELLYQDDGIRVTNLYSFDSSGKVMRTFAFVKFPAVVDKELQKEHDAILNGGSIGAVFKQNGWTITKRQLFSGNVQYSDELSKLQRWMGSFQADSLAINIYAFDVEKGGDAFHYAVIAEVYHPDYLKEADLNRIVGDVEVSGDVSDILKALKSTLNKFE